MGPQPEINPFNHPRIEPIFTDQELSVEISPPLPPDIRQMQSQYISDRVFSSSRMSGRWATISSANFIDDINRVEDAPIDPSLIKNLSSGSHEQILLLATDAVLNDFRVSRPEEPGDRRERDYAQMIRNEKEKSINTMDLVMSDTPVYIGKLASSKYRELFDQQHCPGLIMKDGTRMIVCRRCHLNTPPHYAFIVNGHAYCSEHVPKYHLCNLCNELKEDTKIVETFDDREINVCSNCLKNRHQRGCEVCSRDLPRRNIEFRRCDDHLDNESSGTERNFSRGLKWVSKQKGDVVKSTRMFSAEIETLVKRGTLLDLVSKSVPKEVGIGSDSSVNGDGMYGFEMQTPRLGGKKGEELVYRVAAELKKVEAQVNSTCGLHIHLDGKGLINANRKLYPNALIQLWKAYITFEDVILSLIPYERRFSTYARPLRDAFKLVELDSCDTVLDLERLWYKERHWQSIQSVKSQHHHSSRYFGVNLHPLLGHGHLEIRYHSGTTNPNKILQWVNLHSLIMDAAVAGKFTKAFLKDAQHTTSLKEKSTLLFEKIGMTESSRQYFYGRQKKFTSKTNNESHVA